jgi:hypothetical protein
MFRYYAVLALSLTLFAPLATAQSKTAPPSAPPIQHNAFEREAMADARSIDPLQRMQQISISHTIAERQLQLRVDTEKLVALTAELKQHVDKAGVNILSMDVIKKAQEIQKLAKSVQDKMKNAY